MANRSAVRLPAWLADVLRRDPIRFVDIGARGGWPPKWQEHAEWVTFVGFEPDAEECVRLRGTARPNEHYVDKGLYHSLGEVSLYHCDPPSLTSIYRPDPRVMQRIFGDENATRVVRVETIPVTTLDRALAPLAIGSIDFLKLDTQGSELDILRGGTATLGGPAIGIEVEVEFVAVYEHQPLFPAVAAFLGEHAFELVDLPKRYSSAYIRFSARGARGYAHFGELAANWASLVRRRGGLRGGQRLIYADAIFLREPGAWLAAVQREVDPRAAGLRGFASCCIVGYHEHALEVVEGLRGAGLLRASEVDDAAAYVDATAGTWRQTADAVGRFARRVVHRLGDLGRRP